MADPTSFRILGTTAAAAAVALDTDQVQPGSFLTVFGLSLANASGESVTALFALVTGTEVDAILPKATVASGDCTAANGRWFIGEGQRLRCTVTGAALSGPVTFLVQGRHADLGLDYPEPGEPVPAVGH